MLRKARDEYTNSHPLRCYTFGHCRLLHSFGTVEGSRWFGSFQERVEVAVPFLRVSFGCHFLLHFLVRWRVGVIIRDHTIGVRKRFLLELSPLVLHVSASRLLFSGAGGVCKLLDGEVCWVAGRLVGLGVLFSLCVSFLVTIIIGEYNHAFDTCK